jgi:hypothetical protein
MDTPQLPDDLNPEVVKACAEFIGKITGLVPPPHNAFPPEWHGYLRTFTSRLYEVARENAAPVAPAAVAPLKPVASIVTFDEFVQYGREHGANIVNGMPWSFVFNGHSVTHENDDLYLIGTPSIEFRRGEALVATAFGDNRLIQVLQPPPPTPAVAADAAAYSAPFTTDVPQCCGDPATCNDPCHPHSDGRAANALVDDLSVLVVRLVRALRKASPESDLPAKALDYLYRKDLAPSVLRGGAEGEFARAATTGHCKEGDDCVCGGDLPRVREGCGNWVKGV